MMKNGNSDILELAACFFLKKYIQQFRISSVDLRISPNYEITYEMFSNDDCWLN